MTIPARPKILGIGYPKFAITEFEALQKDFDIFWFNPDDRAQVIGEVARITKEHGPFDGSWVLYDTARYAPFDEEMLGPVFSTPNQCGIFSQGGAGVDSIDVDWLHSKGVYVANTPYAVTDATADMAILLMLNTLRGINERQANCRNGKFRLGMGLADDPAGKTLGIYGMGNIGKNMAKKSKAWDMKVIYHNRTQLSAKEEETLGATYVSFDDLLAESDVLSLNCPLTPQTKGVINKEALGKMKSTAHLVNTARGAVVDEEALIEALQNGTIAGAGLDVLTTEPCASSPLFDMPNVMVIPHCGAFTKGTILKGEREVFANVKSFFDKGVPISYVNDPKR